MLRIITGHSSLTYPLVSSSFPYSYCMLIMRRILRLVCTSLDVAHLYVWTCVILNKSANTTRKKEILHCHVLKPMSRFLKLPVSLDMRSNQIKSVKLFPVDICSFQIIISGDDLSFIFILFIFCVCLDLD